MSGRPWTKADEAALTQWYTQALPVTEADFAPWLKAHPTRSLTATRKKIRTLGLERPEPPMPASEVDTRVSPLGPKPLSEAEMIALFHVDTTRWEPTKLTHNLWQQGSKGPDGELLHQNLHQTTLHLKRIAGTAALDDLAAALLADLRQPAPSAPVVLKVKGDYLLELDPVDLHYGKLGWPEETESDAFDLTIASTDFREAIDDLLGKTAGFKCSEAVIPMLNDLLHTDNLRSETTSGTRVDSDSRYHKMFRRAVADMRWAIDRAKSRAPVVHIKGVPGNHDLLGGWSLMEVIRAVYENDRRVVIDNAPTRRKYHRWGRTLLGYTHGSEEKHSDLPLIMAQERPSDWAATLFRHFRLGHLHRKRQWRFTVGETFMGVEVRVLRSLSGTDAWHYAKGYVKERRAVEAFVHHNYDGEVGAFLSRLPEEAK